MAEGTVGTHLARKRGICGPAAKIEAFAKKHGVAFYPGKMDACYVNGEKVKPQPGGFYGGWITAAITGPFKGESGTEGW